MLLYIINKLVNLFNYRAYGGNAFLASVIQWQLSFQGIGSIHDIQDQIFCITLRVEGHAKLQLFHIFN